MRLLADTHVLIWWLTDAEMISRRALSALEDPINTLYVSAATGYEIELKRPRDPLLRRLPLNLEDAIREEGFTWAPLTPSDCIAAGRLPLHHRNPWDRLLIAQALQDGLVVVSADRRFSDYGVTTLW